MPEPRDPLAEQASQRPEAPALDAGGVTWSYAELDEGADRLARALAGVGIGPSRTVAALVPNGPKAAWCLHGIPRTGATLAPLNTGWTERELVTYLQRVRPSAIVCAQGTEQLASLVAQATTNLVSLDAGGSTRALHVDQLPAEDGELPGPAAADPHTVMPTSGTSGHPKAAAFSLATHLRHARAAADRLGLGAEDRWLAALAPAHIGGLALWLRAAVLGSCVVATQGFDAGTVTQLVDEGAITHASLVPTMLHHLLDAREASPPEGFQLALVGGAPCPPALRDRALEAGWPIALTYGLTEAASQVATAPPSLVRAKPGTVGEPLDGVEVAIGEDEEVLVRGPTLFEGYLGEGEDPVDADGWLHTGDAGELDEDGHLWITGRLSDRIVTGGLTVDPVEVEGVLTEHPGVEAACVVGTPDEEWGEVVTAAVVPRKEDTLDADTLRSFCEGKLASGKLPRGFAFLDALPRNANGKVDRDAVRRRL